jgi:hypothetical protein
MQNQCPRRAFNYDSPNAVLFSELRIRLRTQEEPNKPPDDAPRVSVIYPGQFPHSIAFRSSSAHRTASFRESNRRLNRNSSFW